MSLDIQDAKVLIKHINLCVQQPPAGVVRQCIGNQNSNVEAYPSYLKGYFGAAIFNAIHDAGGMAGEW